MSVLGGEPRRLAQEGWRASVSPDGAHIAFVKGSEKGENEIWLMQADGERPQKVRAADGSYIGTPAWSPDSQHIAFVRSSYTPGVWESPVEIDVLDLTSRNIKILLSKKDFGADLSAMGGLGAGIAWTKDDRLIFSLEEPPPNQSDSNAWWIHIDPRRLQPTGCPTRITSQPGAVADISMTTDGKRLTLTRRTLQPDVYVAGVENQGPRLGELRRLTLDERADMPYSWTPDGRSVIFISDRYGSFNIFKQGVDEATPELLVGGKEQLSIPRLSPDGSEIVYIVQPKVGDASPVDRLMRVSLSGGPAQEILEAPGIMNQQCARAPGSLCLYSQMVSRTEMRLFSFDLTRGKGQELEKARVVDEEAYAYNWSLSPDGLTLAMARRRGRERDPVIRLISTADGSERTIPVQGWPGIACLDWAADGKSIWAVAYTTVGPKSLLNVDLQGRVRPVLEEKKMMLGWAIPSPDGQHLAIWKASGESNVWLVENF
jgi:dipeptidyl aminopeptidase/acylaminoacyl peptidase